MNAAIRFAPIVPAGSGSLAAAAATRRGLLCSMLVAPILWPAALPPVTEPTGDIEQSFAEWKAVKQQIETWPEDDGDEALWSRMRGLEQHFRDNAHTSARAAEISLWVSLPDMMLMNHEHQAILREDVAHLQQYADDPDPAEVVLINAIASLRRLARKDR